MTSLAKIEGEEIVIRIPFAGVKNATEIAWDNHYGFEQHGLYIENQAEWIESFCATLNYESEDGTTVLHEAFDKAVISATEQGEFGINDRANPN